MNINVCGKKLMNVDLVIFDRDGTLIDIYAYWSWMVNKRASLICEKFGLPENEHNTIVLKMGVDDKGKRLLPEGPVGIKKREIVMQTVMDHLECIGIVDAFATVTDIFLQVDEMSKDHLMDIVKLLPGIKDKLKEIRHKGTKISIATTDKTERAKITMSHIGMIDMFDYIIGADMVSDPKPAPEMIIRTLDRLGINKKNAIMIGDADVDIKMGQNAGLLASIGVCSGITKKEDLATLTDYVIADVSSIDIIE